MDREKLISLYQRMSKHSGYQILPEEIMQIIDKDKISITSRHERERFDYIRKHVELRDKYLLDIGGNTGFFTFQAMKEGARHVDYFEGNQTHAEFVQMAGEIYDGSKLSVFNEYYDFEVQEFKYDVVFCLNVIHHLGDDFSFADSAELAKKRMITCINNVSKMTSCMVFQMGFNWTGNVNLPLFPNGTKQEMIEFIRENTKEFWKIKAIGIAEDDQGIAYREIDDKNCMRVDSLGEFLNRPIFIMESITHK